MTSYIFAENIETVGYVYSDRCRISIYFPVRDTGMDDAEVETLLRNLDIDAKIVKMDYNQDEAGHYETKIDMSGITKRAFDKGPAVYTQITSCERLEDYSPYDSPIKWRWPELAKWGISFLTGR